MLLKVKGEPCKLFNDNWEVKEERSCMKSLQGESSNDKEYNS